MTKYDAIVVGAGNGGLTAACRLAKAGKKTLLLEQHNLPGGVASSFRRGRFEFETSLHQLAQIGTKERPAGTRKLLEGEFGLNINWYGISDVFRLITEGSNGTPIDATMPTGRQAFIDKMEEYAPGSRTAMEELFDLAEENLHGLQSLSAGASREYLEEHFPGFVRTAACSVNEVLDTLKLPTMARDLMNTYWGYYAVDCDHLSFMQYASAVVSYVEIGAFIPEYTSNELTSGLVERFRSMGGEIWLNCRAEEILFDGDHVSGVRTERGELETRHVIWNGSPAIAYATMIPKHLVPEREIKLTNARKFSARAFVVYLGLNKSIEELGIKDYCLFLRTSADSIKEYQRMSSFETNKGFLPVCYNVVNPKASPEGTCVMSFTRMYSADCWGDVDPDDYVALKERLADEMIDIYEQKSGIKIRDFIEEIEIATPWTYSRYAGVPQGATYGYEVRDWDNMLARLMMINEDYPIKGLRFSGATGPRSVGYSSTYNCGNMIANLTLKDMAEEEEK